MSNLQEIERAVEQLPAKELLRFRDWFREFEARCWDEQLERDVAGGRLDRLADEALHERRAGGCTDL